MTGNQFTDNFRAYVDAACAMGTTRNALAIRMSISRGQMSMLYNGHNANPQLLTAKGLCNGLGITLDDLLTADAKQIEKARETSAKTTKRRGR